MTDKGQKMEAAGEGAPEISREALTPMMQQYLETKAGNPGCILFFRLGDFYEMFFEDAVLAAKLLNLTLTSRAKGEDAVPMCGVPHHASAHYISKLVDMGHRVAICDQVEDPRAAKGLVKREVTRIVSPGMALDPSLLDAKSENLVASAVCDGMCGLALLDVSTGDFRVTVAGSPGELYDEIASSGARELVIPGGSPPATAEAAGARLPGVTITKADDSWFGPARSARVLKEHFRVATLEPFGIDEGGVASRAAGGLLAYAAEQQRSGLPHIARPRAYSRETSMVIDDMALRNLEVFASTSGGGRRNSLLGVLDRTVTSMGGRMLRSWLGKPLLDTAEINARLDAVAELAGSGELRRGLSALLDGMHDIERLVSKAAMRIANARDLKALGESLGRLPAIKLFMGLRSSAMLSGLAGSIDTVDELARLLPQAICDDPPHVINEGGMIREGFSPELDLLIRLSREGKSFIAGIEARERERTGIASLKVRYNRVFGYYIEVTKPNLHLVPPDYFRKQTTVGAERFVTPELKEYEEKVSAAEERRCALEYEIFVSLRDAASAAASMLSGSARAVAAADALLSLAGAAAANGYCRPEVDGGISIRIAEGRHPVVERVLESERFVPNDTVLEAGIAPMMIVTGPNMAGKSTVMRQVALITIMAQAGSFVPAKSALIGVVDRVFTRIGAGDALSRGLSTFMVEMVEVSTILNQATPRSLIILDEIGRGTSTFDGLSLAWAIAEDIHDRIGARTMLATHYHELTDLALTKTGIRNYTIAVRESKGSIVFLRRLVEGGASRSYGIQVAKLAGLPAAVTKRALEILKNLEAGEYDDKGMPNMASRRTAGGQLPLFDDGGAAAEVARELESIDLDATAPLEALNLLAGLKKKLGDR